MAEEHLNLDALFSLQCDLSFDATHPQHRATDNPPVRIGVARDRAFSFYYEDNFDLLRRAGAAIIPFSPLIDAALPPDLDALYLGGGYPELHAQQLSENIAMLAAIKAFAASNRPIYAECGGMIYLTQHLTTKDSATFPMAAVLPFAIEMTSKLVGFGYVTIELTQDCPLGTRGTTLRGHSFHYSRIINQPTAPTSYRVRYSLSGKQQDEGFTYRNVLASYIHLHFRTAPDVARHFVELARAVKTREPAEAQLAQATR